MAPSYKKLLRISLRRYDHSHSQLSTLELLCLDPHGEDYEEDGEEDHGGVEEEHEEHHQEEGRPPGQAM